MKTFGIIGFPLKSSFSRNLFNEKFEKENIDAYYDLCPIESIEMFPELISKTSFSGMNVTIPYKQAVMPYLTALDETASEIGAVNVIRFEHLADGTQRTTGYNTDAIGFERSLLPLLKPQHKKALVLGTGGASKAVAYVLRKNGIAFTFVSRTKKDGQLTYDELTCEIIENSPLIINTTPLGMYPPESYPDIPYQYLTDRHLLYDLVYNPARTVFLEKGEAQGASIKNGLEMLHGQAVAAWEIWNA
ncbi:MAG: shikimate dehydrogenase [Prevotellaceae bacterium]|nr:shikimate dehydrogenase [Prevotellaceae bacterium]